MADEGNIYTLVFGDLPRQGPGTEAFSIRILNKLPDLGPAPRCADLGCGTGAGSLLLAQHLKAQLLAVDLSEDFLAVLRVKAAAAALSHQIEALHADMGSLGWAAGRLDLIWAEGSAYNLTFAGALQAWRPLLRKGGIAVISEMSWFGSERPKAAAEFWAHDYPQMRSEAENLAACTAQGFEVIGVERLPKREWWPDFYGPLMRRCAALAPEATARPDLEALLAETATEIALFEAHGDHYGYSYYLLQAV